MSKPAATPEIPKWGTVVLVCRECSKRSSGSKDLKPKALSAAARRASKAGTPRTRVVLTNCLGLCPKRATAVALVGATHPARIVAVRSIEQLETALPLMTGELSPAARASLVSRRA